MFDGIGKLVKYFGYLLFYVAFVFIGFRLFLPEYSQNFLSKIFVNNDVVFEKIFDLRVVYPENYTSLNPYNFEFKNRLRLVNIYEPLVLLDSNLNTKSALAENYGIIADDLWEFKLKEGVLFHDSSVFNFDDVFESFERARFGDDSDLKEMLNSIDSIDKIDDYNFRIKTKYPDPLLLQKISTVLIIPSEILNSELLVNPIGTASYKVFSNDDNFILARFDEYWGELAEFDSVTLLTEVDTSLRLDMFLTGGADFLAFVPQDTVSLIGQYNFLTKSVPSLEVHSLFFNFDSELLNNKEIRKFVFNALNVDEIVDVLGEFVSKSNQFVSNGVFGYNPLILSESYTESELKELAKSLDIVSKDISLALPIGSDFFGENIRKQFKKYGVKLNVEYFDVADFASVLKEKKFDMYYLGFKSDLGDSFEFFEDYVLSNSPFNYFSYSNNKVDQLLNNARVNLDEKNRREQLKEVMRILVNEDYFGLPLFEYETIYSFVNNLNFEPRIDALIYFNDIKLRK